MTDTPDDDVEKDNVLRLAKLKANPLFGEREQKPNTAAQPDQSEINSIKDVIDWVNKYYWKITLPGKVRYMSKRVPGKIIFLDRKGFIEDLENLKLTITSEETGKQTITPWSKLWLESRYRSELDDVIFHPDPKYVAQPRIYNLWEGYKIKPKEGDVASFLNYIKDVFTGDDKRSYNYLVALISQMFQQPHLKPGVAVVIRGDEGVGKSFFIEKLCYLMSPYFFVTSNPTHVFGDHNSQLKDKIILHLEEAVWPGGKKTESLLKDLITNPTIPINEKFQPIITVANHMHLFITGNPDWLVHAGTEARRIFALYASVGHMKDIPYFRGLDEWFYKQGDAEALLYYFLHFDFQAALDEVGISDLRLVPVTKELIVQKKASMSEVKEWANNWLELGQWPYGRVGDNGHCYVIKSMLYRDYIRSQRLRRNGNILTERKFGIQFCELFPDYDDQGKKHFHKNGRLKHIIGVDGKEIGYTGKQFDAYDIPPVAELRATWDINLGGATDWEEMMEWGIKYGDNRVSIDDMKDF